MDKIGGIISQNFIAAGLAFFIIAYVLFILLGFVLAVKVPNIEPAMAGLTGQEITQEEEVIVEEDPLSILWFALLALSIIVTAMGARTIWLYRSGKK